MITKVVAATVAALVCACGSGGGFPDARPSEPPPNPGTFAVDWTIVDSAQNPLTCAQASATTVVVSIHDSVTGASFSSPFNCNLGGAISGSLPPSNYDLAFTLTGTSGTLATAPAQNDVIIESDKTTRVMAVTFVVQ